MLGSTLSLGAALFWATSVILFKKSGESISPIPLNIYKSFVALILLAITMLVLDVPFFPNKPFSEWALLAFSGVIGIAIADVFFFIALEKLGAGLVAIVECLYLPSVILLSCIFLGEILSTGAIVGGVLILTAVVISSLPKRKSRTLDDKPKIAFSGIFYGCIAMFFVAVGIVSIKSILETTDVLWATYVRVFAGLISLLLLTVFHPRRVSFFKELKFSKAWIYAFPASVAGNYFALLCWIGGMKYSSGASEAAILNQMSTVFTFILAALFLKEKIDANRLTAILLAFIGACLTIFW